MWSFVIVDKEKNSFLLSNDRFGEKPLYYYKDKKSFIFASELSYFKNFYSIDFSPNLNKLESFLRGYRILKQDDKTFIKNIFSFPQSNIWKISNKLKIKKKKYWDLKYTPNYDISDLDIKKTSALLQRSIELRSRSDVEVGISLSGGIDSSLISYFFHKNIKKNFQTFTIIDKDERYNEEKILIQFSQIFKTQKRSNT